MMANSEKVKKAIDRVVDKMLAMSEEEFKDMLNKEPQTYNSTFMQFFIENDTIKPIPAGHSGKSECGECWETLEESDWTYCPGCGNKIDWTGFERERVH